MRKINPASLLRFLLIPASLLLLISIGIYINSSFHHQENRKFTDFTHNMFVDEVTSNTLNLHYTLSDPKSFEIDDYMVTLGAADEESLAASTAVLENYQEALNQISYKKLSKNNQLTYDILAYYLKNQNNGKDFSLYAEPLGPTIGTQAQLPVLLAEYTFNKKADVDEYLSLLSQLDTYYASLLEFEKAKSSAGLFMSDANTDAIIAQCQSFIADPDNNFLIEIFNDKVDSFPELTPEECANFKVRHKDIILKKVIPAYENLITGLTALKGTGKNNAGLCNFPDGKKYYEYLVKDTTGSNASIDQIQKRLMDQVQTDFTELQTLLAKNPTLLSSVSGMAASSPEAILNDLQKKMADDFPTSPQVNVNVKYVHSSLEKYLSPAFYLSPPIDNLIDNVIYINQASDYSGLELYTTLAHEGYPGHLYQTIYSGSTNADPVRSLLNFGGYSEGWATYVEFQSYQYADVDQDVAALYRLNRSIMLGISSLLDIAINYHGYDRNATAAYLNQIGFSDPEIANNMYDIIIEAPANYLKYYVGCLSFMDIRDKFKKELGDKFNLKEFHEQILTIGPAPFPVLEKYLENYYQLG